ncbi:RCC1 domain-containing protein, partial [Cytophaga hutchinsonii]
MFKFRKLYYTWIIAVISLLATVQVKAQDLLISGGYAYSTAICANGNVYSWGQNNAGTPSIKGTLGIGSATDPILSPTRVLFPTNDPYFSGVLGLPNITIRAVDAGSTLTLMALDCHTGVWTVGMNNDANGVLGQGPGKGGASTVPARVLKGEYTGTAYHPSLSTYLTNVKSISGGDNMNYVIMNGSGEVMSWGLNANGQLGNGTTTSSTTPVYVRTNATTTLKNAIQIEAGDKTGYALIDPDGDGIGTVYSWGANTNGELGRSNAGGTNNGTENGPNSNYASPVVFKTGLPLDNIVSISAGDVMCFAIDVDGFVWAWGNNGWFGLCGTGPGGVHSDPKRVLAGEWATTPGGAGQTFLKARAIGGGQGFGMAVSIDGIPLAWGGNGGNNGYLGNGSTTPSDVAVIIRTSAAAYDTDVIGISDGDGWGFYTRRDGSLRTWGFNAQGQLGIGNTTSQVYAVTFALPGGCAIPDPKPFAKITPRDQNICPGSWTGTLLNSQFNVSGALAPNYTIRWYKDGSATPITGATTSTYNATAIGTYKVVVKYIGASVPCATYPDAIDEITIAEAVAPYTANAGTYCGTTGTFSVTGYTGNLTNFQWFKDAVGGTAIPITPATTPPNTSNTITTALTNATMVNATTYRLWAEDIYGLDNYAAKTPPCATTSRMAINGGSFAVAFTLAQTNGVIINSIDVTAWDYNNKTVSYQVRILSDNGSNSPDFASNIWTSPTKTMDFTASAVQQSIPLNFNASILTPGTKYWMQIISTDQFTVADYTDCSANPLPLVDDSGKGVLTIGNSYKNSSVNTKFPNIYNFNIKRGIAYPCKRIPVDITKDCPPCTKPSSVTITTPSTGTVTLCQGTAQNLIGSATVTAAAQNTNFTYSWI